MKQYQRLRLLAAAILFIELAVGLGGVLTPQREIFPFASWFLFSLVPGRVTSYDLMLSGSPGQPLDPPRPFSQAGGLVKQPHSVTIYQLVQQLGRAEERGDRALSLKLRRQIETKFVAAPMRYELIKQTYSLAERWKNQPPHERASIKSFIAGEP
jgi:hypothetical protein